MNVLKKIIFLVIGVLIGFVFWQGREKPSSIPSEPLEEELFVKEEPIEPQTYTLLFVGDVMLDRSVKRMVKQHGEDYTFPFLKINNTLNQADLLFGNLESMISDKGRDVGGKYSFRAEPDAIEGLLFANFSALSLANNHAFDWGRDAFEDTMTRLKEADIEYTGGGFDYDEAHSPTVITINNELKVGFLGYTEFLFPYAMANENRSGVSVFNEDNMHRDIINARDEVDLLVVTLHYGSEYQKQPNEKQVRWSKQAIDSGADVVIGHHPHVTQPVEKYKDGFIAYSLGNFLFDQYFSEETMSGFMLQLEASDEGDVQRVEKIHYKLNSYYQPEETEREIFWEK